MQRSVNFADLHRSVPKKFSLWKSWCDQHEKQQATCYKTTSCLLFLQQPFDLHGTP